MTFTKTKCIFWIFMLVLSCKKEDANLHVSDYLKFDLGMKTRAYQDIDSIFQICGPSNLVGKFQYYSRKTFKSSDNEFYSFDVVFNKDSIDCPINNIDANSHIFLTLTKKTGIEFVDFDNNYRIKLPLSWTQEYYQNKIVVKGKFSGWMYQHYPYRSGVVIEPALLDSVQIENGEFQVTIK